MAPLAAVPFPAPSEDDAARAPEPFRVMLLGHAFLIVDKPRQGPLLMMARRLNDKNTLARVAAVVQMLEAWIVPEEHPQLHDAIETIEDVSVFMETDLARFIEAVVNRPTSGPSSSPTG